MRHHPTFSSNKRPKHTGLASASWVMMFVLAGLLLGVVVGAVAVWQVSQKAAPGQTPVAAVRQAWAHWWQDIQFSSNTQPTDDPNLRSSGELNSPVAIAKAYADWRTGQETTTSIEASTNAFKQLLMHAPGLENLIRYRHGQWLARQIENGSTEWAVQQALLPGTGNAANVGQKALLYALGQSYIRSNMDDKATAVFTDLLATAPQSEQAIGAHYYLMELARQAGDTAAMQKHGWAYLTASPTGTFAAYVAMQLQDLAPESLSQQQQQLLALGLAQSADNVEAVTQILRHHPPSQSGWVRALAMAGAGQNPFQTVSSVAVVSSLAQSDYAPSKANVAQVLGVLRKYLSLDKQAASLSQALSALPNNARHGEQLWWRLAVILEYQGREPSARAAYNRLMTQYPDSDYTPESTRQLLLPLWRQAITQNDSAALGRYIAQAEQFVKRYPYASSTVWVGYWQAKAQEKQGQTEQAIQTYHAMVRDYPDTYYGMRAQQRLNALRHNQPDTLWYLAPSWPVPTAEQSSPQLAALLPQLPEWQALPQQTNAMANTLATMVDSSQSPHLAADLLLALNWADESMPEGDTTEANWLVNAAKARYHQLMGEPHVAIRAVYDATKARARHKDIGAFHPPKGWQQLVYPVAHSVPLLMRHDATGVHPWLGMALMRQESFFNPNAVSSSDARGLMQLLVPTAREVAGWEGLAAEFAPNRLFEPELNIQLGMRYLQFLFEKFEPYGPTIQPMLSAGAYNGGPNAMARWAGTNAQWLSQDPDVFVELIPYTQSREYIYHVLGGFWQYHRLYGVAP